MRHGYLFVSAAAAVLGMLPSTASAKVVADPRSIAAVMQKEGYRAEISTDDVGDPKIESSTGGYKFAVLFYGCKDGKNCKTVQFYGGFTLKDGDTVELEKLNNWNKARRFGRVYRDDVGDPVIEMDVDLEAGGMSDELFADNLAYWDSILGAFADYVFDRDIQEP